MFERLGRWMWARWKHRWGLVLGTTAVAILSGVLILLSTINIAWIFDFSARDAVAFYVVVASSRRR